MYTHIDCFNAHWDSDDDFTISLVRHNSTGRIFVEIEAGDEIVYVPTTLDPAEVAGWDGTWPALVAQSAGAVR